jgi:hypothetical protein
MQSMMWHLQRLLHSMSQAVAAPARNPRMAVVIGRLLGAAFLLCFATGIYSHFIQEPLPWMVFPTRPIWLYQLSQGVHITAGILCFPLLFAKLYTVFPELFATPPVRSFRHLLERASIALFVAASLVQITIGLLNTYQWYALFPFPFRQTHYALSFVIIGSLAIHIAVKLQTISQYWTKRSSFEADGETLVPALNPHVSTSRPNADRPAIDTQPYAGVTGRVVNWIEATPKPAPTPSRRGFLMIVGVLSAALVTLTAGQSFRLLDGTNLFAPRKNGVGPNSLPVNRTAKAAKVLDTATDAGWALTVSNGTTVATFTRAELAALPQHEVQLPIACVEGWSQLASWRGPRLRDLADAVGAPEGASLRAVSLEQKSSYARTTVYPEYVRDELTLVALEVNGEELDLDHGYPARLIAPGRPGVLQTKWLSSLEVLA